MKQKHYKQLINVFGIIMLAISCQNRECKFAQAPTQVFLTEENMPPIEYFTLKKVELPASAQMDRWYYLHADTLLLTEQNKHPDPYLLSVYNLKTQELVAGYFTKGMGPGELISAHCIFREDEVFVIDYTQNKVAVLSIDSIALLGFDYIPTIISTDGICTEYTRCVNETLIGINDFHFYGFGYENVPEFVTVSCTDGKFPENYMPKIMKGVGPMNINMRISYFNEFTKQYIVAWRHFPYINIYDEKFNLQKQYVGPDTHMPNLIARNDDGIFFEPDSVRTRYYMMGCQTKNHIFYINDRFQGNSRNLVSVNDEVYCFDKSLNLVRRFKQKDSNAELLLPSYCEKTDNLYFEICDENTGDYVLCKCVFDK